MKITIIAPIEGIIHTVNIVLAKQNFSAEIEVVLGNLESGLEQACLAVEQGADVLISRGETASLIAKHIDIPLVEIEVTVFDILQSLNRIEDTAGTIGVVFVRRLLFECEKLGHLIGVNMQEIFTVNEVLAQEKIIAAHRSGISTFLGDASAVRILRRNGFAVFPIDSGEDAIIKAIFEAINLATVRRKERERVELLRTMIHTSTDGIIAIDKQGNINAFNPVAEQIWKIKSSAALGKYIGNVLPDDKLSECLVNDQYEATGIKNIGGKVYAIKRNSIKIGGEVVGAIANIENAMQPQQLKQELRQKFNRNGLVAKFRVDQLIGSSMAMKAVKKRVRQYAGTDIAVLITGESGTGKERVAQSIHSLSQRKNGPFVAVNCAALPETLLESELFGYEEGAFTGAKKSGKAGLFELAHGGTIFLDEISEIPLSLQARLLRVLQEKEVMRLGGDRVLSIDVRVLSATNQDLMALVKQKKFREDVYYRLDVLRLKLPPLRDRIEDIPELVNSFLAKCHSASSSVVGISKAAIAFLQQCTWKGNIRELENVIDRMTLLVQGPMIEEADLRQEFSGCDPFIGHQLRGDRLKELEKQKIKQILLEEKYNYTQSAIRLGLSRTTLWRKIHQWENSY